MHDSSGSNPTRWYEHLYVQTVLGVLLGVYVGFQFPEFGKSLKPLGEGFIALIKMVIGPIIFCTIVHGIASVGDIRKLGQLGWKVLLYFEVVSTLALAIGLVVVNVAQPGVGFVDSHEVVAGSADIESKGKTAIENSKELKPVDFLLHLIPKTLFSPFASGDLLQTLLVSILIAIAILGLGDRRTRIVDAIDAISQVLFALLRILVKLAPLGAFGAMAFTVAEFGGQSLIRLVGFMLLFYLTAFLFIAVVLNAIARFCRFSLWRFLLYIKEEILLVLGTSSSETALPGLMQKLVKLGCSKSTVGLVVPTGYSFNLDGTNIYMSMAAIFIAQAAGVQLTLVEQLSLLGLAMLTSKGASGVTGAGFVTLIATIQAFERIPVETAFLLIGIDRFMSECRALTNFIGNGVATLVISRWEDELPEEINFANAGLPGSV